MFQRRCRLPRHRPSARGRRQRTTGRLCDRPGELWRRLRNHIEIEVAAIGTGWTGSRYELARRCHAHAAQHGMGRKLEFDPLALRIAQAHGFLVQIDIPAHQTRGSLAHQIPLELGRINPFYRFREQRNQAEPKRAVAPIAIYPYSVEMNNQSIPRFSALDVKRSCQWIPSIRKMVSLCILAARVEGLGPNGIAAE